MKFSEATIEDLKAYARVEHDNEDLLFGTILDAAKGHIRIYTGLDDAKLDALPDVSIALLTISNEMYEIRTATRLDNKASKINELLDRILGSHSINLL